MQPAPISDPSHYQWESLYQTVCVERPPCYSQYEQFDISWGDQLNYQVVQKIGRGQYSEVFEGCNLINNMRCVIKILKPVRVEKIHREIKILQTLFGGPNIVKLYDVVKVGKSQTPALIYEHIPNVEARSLFKKLDDFEIRMYLYKILEALDYSHKHGIMHRDVKPQNIVINHEENDLRLIDWGLADFYQPGQEYNTRVASRYYKGPELLVEDVFYHYSLDIWSLGCTMAGMIFKKDPFFKGSDNDDQLIKITRFLGTEALNDYLKKYKITLPESLAKLIRSCPAKDVKKMVTKNNQELCPKEALDLLMKMLVYDKNLRITAVDAMKHPYFDPVRDIINIDENYEQQ